MTNKIFLTSALLLLGLLVTPLPAEAGWNAWLRFCGEYWSDGYHSKGDPWNKPTKQARQLSSYQPVYPAYEVPVSATQVHVPTPANRPEPVVGDRPPRMIPAKSN